MPEHFLFYVASGIAAYVMVTAFLETYICNVPDVFLRGNDRLLRLAFAVTALGCVAEIVA